MTTCAMVQVDLWKSYPGRYPGERGMLNKVVVRFLDRDNRVAVLAHRIWETKKLAETAYESAVACKKGLIRNFWFWRTKFLTQRERGLIHRARISTRNALRGAPRGIGWQIVRSTADGDVFYPLETFSDRNYLLSELISAKEIAFTVIESASQTATTS